MKTADILKIIAGLVTVFGVIWATVLEFPNFSNTMGFFEVLLKGAAIWIPLCILLASAISAWLGSRWYNGLLIGLTAGVFTFPLFSSLVNRIGMKDQMIEERTAYLGMDARIKDRGVRQVGPIPDPDEYHVFFGDEEAPLRLIVQPDPHWLTIDPGDTVYLRWIPGRLGGKTFSGIDFEKD